MFTGDFQESKMSEGKFFGMSHEAFLDFLRYLYTDEITNLENHVIELLETSDIYEVEGLKKICEDQLMKGLTEENSADIFQYAHLYRCQMTVKKAAFQLIKKSFAKNRYEISDELLNQPEEMKELIETRNKLSKLLQSSTSTVRKPE